VIITPSIDLTVIPVDSVCLGVAYNLRDAITSPIPANTSVYYALYGENETLNPYAILTENYPHIYQIRVVMDNNACSSQPQFVELRPNPQDVHILGTHLCIHNEANFYVESFHIPSENLAANTWFSSDSAVAYIDPNTGVVTAHSVGSFFVTCHYETTDGCFGELISNMYFVYPRPTVMEHNVTVCAGTEVQTSDLVHYILNADMYRVFDAPVGGNDIGASFIANETDTLYIEPQFTWGICDGNRQQVIVRVVTEPTFNLTQTEVSMCPNAAIDLATLVTNVNISNYHVLVFENNSYEPLPTTIVTPSTSTYYRIRVVSNNISTCVSVDSLIHLVIDQQQYVSLTVDDAAICVGTTETIIATPSVNNGTYQWNTSNRLIAEIIPFNGDSAKIHALSAGMVTISYSYEETTGCVGYGEKVITVNAVPEITSNNTGMTVCKDTYVSFGSLATASAGSILQVYRNGVLQNTDHFIADATVIYEVRAYNLATGCASALQQVIVNVTPRPVIRTTNPEICMGESIALSSVVDSVIVNGIRVDNYTLTYQDAGGLTIDGNVSPDMTTTYRIVAEVNGCNSEVTIVTVTVNPKPILYSLAVSPICQNMEFDLRNVIDTTHLGSSFILRFYSDQECTSLVINPFIPQQSTYYAQADVNACLSDVIAINIPFKPVVEPHIYGAEHNIVCENSTFNYVTETSTEISNYQWTVVNGVINGSSTNSSVSVTWIDSGVGLLTVSYTKDGCEGMSEPYVVTIEHAPVAAIINPDTIVCEGSTVTYFAQAGAAYYLWNISGAVTYSASDNFATVVWGASGTGIVQVTTISENGCMAISQATHVRITQEIVPSFVQASTEGCVGEISYFEVIPQGADYNYQWSYNGGTLVSGGSASDPFIAIRWGSTGSSANVTVLITSSTQCVISNPISLNIHINPIPTVVVTNPVVCYESSVSLNDLATSDNQVVYYKDSLGTILLTYADVEHLTDNVTYYAQAVNVAGCVGNIVEGTIYVRSELTLALSQYSAEICEGGTFDITTLPINMLSNNVIYRQGGLAVSNPHAVDVSGVYNIILEDIHGCRSEPAEFTLTVTPIPEISINGEDNLCVGSVVGTLHATVTPSTLTGMGVWTITSGSAATINPITGEITGVHSGTFTVTYTFTTNTGCVNRAVSEPMTVYVSPTAQVVSELNVCEGSVVNYNDLIVAGSYANGGVSYKIYADAALTQQLITGGHSLPLYSNTDYYIVITGNTGCQSPVYHVAVNIISGLSFAIDTGYVCSMAGSTVNLNDLVHNVVGATYWKLLVSQNGSIPTENTIVTAGTYSVILVSLDIDGNTLCSSIPQTVQVIPNNSTSVTLTTTPVDVNTICEGSTLFMNAVPAGVNAVWTSSDPTVATINNFGLLHAVRDGVVIISYQAANAEGCVYYGNKVLTVHSIPQISVTHSRVACEGSSLDLSQLVSAPSNVNLTFFASPMDDDTIYSPILVTNNVTMYVEASLNGCKSSPRESINIITEATPSFVFNDAAICAGSTFDLYDAISGITNATNQVFEFTYGVGGIAIPDPHHVSVERNYAARIVNGTSAGCASTVQSMHLTVNPLPTINISGAMGACINSVVPNFMATPAGGTWITSNPTIAEINPATGAVVMRALGTVVFTYSYTNANGCTNQASVNFTVTSIPTLEVSENFTVCSGSTINIPYDLVESFNGTAVRVYDNVTNTLITAPTQTLTTNKTYRVVAVNADGCESIPKYITVYVQTMPVFSVTSPVTICNGESVDLSQLVTNDILPNGYHYVYSIGNNTGFENPVVSPSITTSYHVALQGPAPLYCTSEMANIMVTVSPSPILLGKAMTPICANETVDLSQGLDLTYLTGTYTIKYYADAAGTLEVQQIVVPTQTVYYAKAIINDCSSLLVPINVVIRTSFTPTIQGVGELTVCQNNTYTYTTELGANITNYHWTVTGGTVNGNANQRIVSVTWDIAGQGTLMVSYDKDGCSGVSDMMFFNVVAPPVAMLVEPQTTVCGGTTVTYTAQNGAASYQWTISGATTYTTNGNMAVVTWQNYGNGTIQVTAMNANGCSTASAITNITINPTITPSFVMPQVEVCANEVVQYTVFPTGNYTYYWSYSGGNMVVGGTATDNTLTVKWGSGSTGNVVCTVADPNGCVSNTQLVANIHINVIPNVTITNPVICNGTTLQLNDLASSTGNTVHYYLDSTTTIPLVLGDLENLTSSMYYYVIAENNAGCASTVYRGLITVRPEVNFTITATTDSICRGETFNLVNLLSESVGANTVTYYYGGVAVSNPQAVSLSGIYTIEMTNALGCSSESQEFELVVNETPQLLITGDGNFCANSTLTSLQVTLVPNTVAGAGQWSIASGNAATINPVTGALTGVTTGNIKATYTFTTSAGCVVSATSETMTVMGMPVIVDTLSVASVCNGDYLQVHVPVVNWNGTQPMEGTWTLGGTAFNPATTPVTVADSGKLLKYVINAACGQVTGSGVMISVALPPVMNPIYDIILCNGEVTGDIILGLQPDMTYSWTQIGGDNIGMSSMSGTNIIPSFTAVNAAYTPLTAVIKVTVSNGTCEGNSITFNIRVNPQVVMTSPSVINNFCSESTLDYNITSSNGSAIISWTRPAIPGINNGLGNSGSGSRIMETLINNTASTIVVTYNISFVTGNCTSTAQLSVVVNPVPQITIPSTIIVCSNSTVADIAYQIPPVQQGMVLYYSIFFSNEAQNAGLTNILNAPLPTTGQIAIPIPATLPFGNYQATFVIHVEDGCTSPQPLYFTISKVGLPEITQQPQSITMCDTVGFSLSVEVTGGGILGYQWYLNDIPIAGANESVYTVETPTSSDFGTYYVKVFGSCGSIVSETAKVGMNPLVLLTHFMDYGGGVIFISDPNHVFVRFQWYKNGVPIGVNGNYQSYVEPNNAPLNGTYQLYAEYADGTGFMSCPLTIIPSKMLEGEMKVYPNPVSVNGEIVIDVSDLTNVEFEQAEVEIFDANSKLVLKTQMRSARQRLIVDFRSGMYFIYLRTDSGEMKTSKFVVN
jgi:hypothetical protein